jgi:hypothetical protein
MANQTTITANKEFVREFIDRVFNEHNAKATHSSAFASCRAGGLWPELGRPV